MHSVHDRVKDIMIEHLDLKPDSLSDDASFSKQLGMDSLDAMDLLMVIDEEFGIRIPPQEMEGIDNLRTLVAAVEKERK